MTEQDRKDILEMIRNCQKWSSPIPQYEEMKKKLEEFVKKGK